MLAHSPSIGATISKPTASLRRLPPATEVAFPGLFGWSPVSTGSLTAALRLDRGLFATWRCRGIGPAELPANWFRPAPGRPVYYRVDQVLSWIAARRGDRLDTLTTWRLSLARDFGTEADDPNQIRRLAAMYARAAGPKVGEVTFTAQGWRAYLDSLA